MDVTRREALSALAKKLMTSTDLTFNNSKFQVINDKVLCQVFYWVDYLSYKSFCYDDAFLESYPHDISREIRTLIPTSDDYFEENKSNIYKELIIQNDIVLAYGVLDFFYNSVAEVFNVSFLSAEEFNIRESFGLVLNSIFGSDVTEEVLDKIIKCFDDPKQFKDLINLSGNLFLNLDGKFFLYYESRRPIIVEENFITVFILYSIFFNIDFKPPSTYSYDKMFPFCIDTLYNRFEKIPKDYFYSVLRRFGPQNDTIFTDKLNVFSPGEKPIFLDGVIYPSYSIHFHFPSQPGYLSFSRERLTRCNDVGLPNDNSFINFFKTVYWNLSYEQIMFLKTDAFSDRVSFDDFLLSLTFLTTDDDIKRSQLKQITQHTFERRSLYNYKECLKELLSKKRKKPKASPDFDMENPLNNINRNETEEKKKKQSDSLSKTEKASEESAEKAEDEIKLLEAKKAQEEKNRLQAEKAYEESLKAEEEERKLLEAKKEKDRLKAEEEKNRFKAYQERLKAEKNEEDRKLFEAKRAQEKQDRLAEKSEKEKKLLEAKKAQEEKDLLEEEKARKEIKRLQAIQEEKDRLEAKKAYEERERLKAEDERKLLEAKKAQEEKDRLEEIDRLKRAQEEKERLESENCEAEKAEKEKEQAEQDVEEEKNGKKEGPETEKNQIDLEMEAEEDCIQRNQRFKRKPGNFYDDQESTDEATPKKNEKINSEKNDSNEKNNKQIEQAKAGKESERDLSKEKAEEQVEEEREGAEQVVRDRLKEQAEEQAERDQLKIEEEKQAERDRLKAEEEKQAKRDRLKAEEEQAKRDRLKAEKEQAEINRNHLKRKTKDLKNDDIEVEESADEAPPEKNEKINSKESKIKGPQKKNEKTDFQKSSSEGVTPKKGEEKKKKSDPQQKEGAQSNILPKNVISVKNLNFKIDKKSISFYDTPISASEDQKNSLAKCNELINKYNLLATHLQIEFLLIPIDTLTRALLKEYRSIFASHLDDFIYITDKFNLEIVLKHQDILDIVEEKHYDPSKTLFPKVLDNFEQALSSLNKIFKFEFEQRTYYLFKNKIYDSKLDPCVNFTYFFSRMLKKDETFPIDSMKIPDSMLHKILEIQGNYLKIIQQLVFFLKRFKYDTQHFKIMIFESKKCITILKDWIEKTFFIPISSTESIPEIANTGSSVKIVQLKFGLLYLTETNDILFYQQQRGFRSDEPLKELVSYLDLISLNWEEYLKIVDSNVELRLKLKSGFDQNKLSIIEQWFKSSDSDTKQDFLFKDLDFDLPNNLILDYLQTFKLKDAQLISFLNSNRKIILGENLSFNRLEL